MSSRGEEHVGESPKGPKAETSRIEPQLIESSSNVANQDSQQRRLSSHSFSNLPEVVPVDTYSGLQVVAGKQHHEKLVIQDNLKQIAVIGPEEEKATEENLPEYLSREHYGEVVHLEGRQVPPQKSRVKEVLDRKICGIRARWIVLGLALLLLLVIILGIGLGLGLRSSDHSKTPNDSKPGAHAGTRIALATQTFPTNGQEESQESLVMYFQHWTGQIRWMQLDDNGVWTGGDLSTVVATNAKNNTPISAVSYVWDGVSFWRVFYIDNTNIIREVWAGNNTQGWALGPLSDMRVSPMDDDQVGMVACWYGPTTPAKYAEGYATTTDSSRLAIRLVYATNATTFKQLSYHGDTQIWTPGQTLSDLNGHASPTCYNRGQGTIDYLMFLDLQNTVNIYWQDSNTNLTNTTSHPINVWTNTSITIPSIAKSATLAYTKFLYAQSLEDNLIRAYNISFDAENTILNTNSGFVVQGNPGIPETGLGVTTQPNPVGGDDVLAIYQVQQSDLLYYRRDVDDVSWSGANIQIPV